MRDSVLSAITQMRQDDPQPARHSTHAVPVGQLPDGSHVRPIPARHATTRRLTRVVTAVMGVAALVAAVALAGWSYGRSQITRNYRADAAACPVSSAHPTPTLTTNKHPMVCASPTSSPTNTTPPWSS